MPDRTTVKPHPDADIAKGATEDGYVPVSYTGQLPHRLQPEEVKDADSDFPEPGSSPEHSGQHPDPKAEK